LSSRESLSSQYLIVQGVGGSKASLQACERTHDSTWTEALPVFDCVVGSNGIAAIGHKREGDGMTPCGNFSLGELFGWTTTTDPLVQQFKTDYRYIADAKDENGFYLDKFVDDVNSTHYNSWVVGPTSAKSFEQMHISAYTYGLVINYNMYPTVPGMPARLSSLVTYGLCDVLSLWYRLRKCYFYAHLVRSRRLYSGVYSHG
jgi:L,D-peptidoglycan transpeptidase YkuD (ErfK/YbiS/YcfS/YnhG family)